MSRQRDHDVHACRLAASGDFHLPGAQDHYPPDLSVEPLHIEIDLVVDIEARVVEGAVTHTLVARRAGALQTGYLYHYAFAMLAGVVVLVTWYLFQH